MKIAIGNKNCNKKSLIFIAILLFANFLMAEWVDVYKKGIIKLVNSPGFGENTDWDSLFYDHRKSIAIAEDGSIFVSSRKEHTIYKFSPSGDYLKKFGRKGRGPGDLYFPHGLSILDRKYLIIAEYPINKQISCFDLQGKYIKKLMTKFPVFGIVPLKKGKIAYFDIIRSSGDESKVNIFIKDVKSENEQLVETITFLEKNFIALYQTKKRLGNNKMSGSALYVGFDNYIGEVFTERTQNGNLLVGLSSSPEIRIFSIQGKLAHSFKLKITPIVVAPNYIQGIKEKEIKEAKESGKSYAKDLEDISFERFFTKHLPYYKKILVDSEGNILVFKWPDCVNNCEIVFQVYSPDGKYICESTIDKGIYDFEISKRKNMFFTNKGIIGLFQLKESDEISLRLIKVNIE